MTNFSQSHIISCQILFVGRYNESNVFSLVYYFHSDYQQLVKQWSPSQKK